MGRHNLLMVYSYTVFGISLFVKGEFIESTYSMDVICDDINYGMTLLSETGVPSSVICAARCAVIQECKSFTYNNITDTCLFNSDTFNTSTITTCSTFIKYGVKPGNQFCLDGNSCTITVEGIRLCDGDGPGLCNATKGRVEMKINGTWGTICDDLWNDSDYTYDYDTSNDHGFSNAQVVCNVFGYSTGIPRPNGYFTGGLESTQILFDGVVCSGSEDHLLDCTLPVIGITNCNHNEDVGVECS